MSNGSNTGMSFLGWLTLLFVSLKLLGTIDWSWWWVLAPMWIPSVITLALVSLFFWAWPRK